MSRHEPLPFDPVAEAERQWRAREWAAPDAMAAVTSIMRAHQILIGRINRLLAPLDLTFARYEVLVLLSFSRHGSLPLKIVGERLQVHPASVTNAIDRLEQAGLVRRVPNPRDGRGVIAELTHAGVEATRTATRGLTEARFGADGLDDAEAQRLTTTIRVLRRHAGDYSG